jgi:hypothetical protein
VEPAIYAYDPELEVELEILVELDDEWFDTPIVEEDEEEIARPWLGERLLCRFVYAA